MTELLDGTAANGVMPANGVVDVAAVQDSVRQLLIAVGEDPDREGLAETPRRVAAWWAEFLTPDPAPVGALFDHHSVGEEWVSVSGVVVRSMCEHHLLPMHVTFTIGYVPARKVIGLSKIARIAQQHAGRLQLQERLTQQIAQTLAQVTGSPDVGVWGVGEHLCMSMRGVKAVSARTSTGCLMGRLKDDPAFADRLRHAGDGGATR